MDSRSKKNKVVKTKLVSALIYSLLCCIPVAFSAEENQNKYPSSYFEQYTPQNSLQMIERLPGFKFNEGENNRGFGGNAGNVLIDGARPTSKSGGLSGALTRIPAAQVDYIEILRGV